MPDTYDPIADAWASYAAAQDALRVRHEAALAAGNVPAPLYPEPPATGSEIVSPTHARGEK